MSASKAHLGVIVASVAISVTITAVVTLLNSKSQAGRRSGRLQVTYFPVKAGDCSASEDATTAQLEQQAGTYVFGLSLQICFDSCS